LDIALWVALQIKLHTQQPIHNQLLPLQKLARAAGSSTIFGTASNANLINVLESFIANWKAFYTSHGIPGNATPTADQIDLAARGAAWGDMVGVALANYLGPLDGQVINFLDDAAQGTDIWHCDLQTTRPPCARISSRPSRYQRARNCEVLHTS
jgi:hypothetical protein